MDVILVGESLKKYFGNVRAVDDVSLKIYRGETIGIIGPNGAGKTTLLNILSGILKPDSGRILFKKGNDNEFINITGWNPARISKLGIARAFQTPNLFENLRVIDNLRTSLVAAKGLYSKTIRPYDLIEEVEEDVWKLLYFFELKDKANILVKDLSHGEKKILDVALALASKPSIIFLDEPTAGLSAVQKPMIINLLKKLKAETNVAIVIIEHDLDVVFEVSERVIVMHEGKILSEGTPEEVRRDPKVRQAYLGEEI